MTNTTTTAPVLVNGTWYAASGMSPRPFTPAAARAFAPLLLADGEVLEIRSTEWHPRSPTRRAAAYGVAGGRYRRLPISVVGLAAGETA